MRPAYAACRGSAAGLTAARPARNYEHVSTTGVLLQKLGSQEVGPLVRKDSIGSENSSMADRQHMPPDQQPRLSPRNPPVWQNPEHPGQNLAQHNPPDWQNPEQPGQKRGTMQAAAGILLSLSSL